MIIYDTTFFFMFNILNVYHSFLLDYYRISKLLCLERRSKCLPIKNDMSEQQSLLQRFFDASLIPSETNDERLKHYQAAAADLAKRFGESPREAVSASRVAIDPNCSTTDPWFSMVQDAVKVHWKTFLVKNYDAPRQICRAILLEALSKAAEEMMAVPC